MSANETPARAAADLPIELEHIDQPGSLRRVHLYSLRDEPLAAGERFEFVGPHDKTPGVSWYKGCLAVTDVVTPKPIYSRSPVVYATASVVIDPAGGEPLRIILQRRIHQDSPD